MCCFWNFDLVSLLEQFQHNIREAIPNYILGLYCVAFSEQPQNFFYCLTARVEIPASQFIKDLLHARLLLLRKHLPSTPCPSSCFFRCFLAWQITCIYLLRSIFPQKAWYKLLISHFVLHWKLSLFLLEHIFWLLQHFSSRCLFWKSVHLKSPDFNILFVH